MSCYAFLATKDGYNYCYLLFLAFRMILDMELQILVPCV